MVDVLVDFGKRIVQLPRRVHPVIRIRRTEADTSL